MPRRSSSAFSSSPSLNASMKRNEMNTRGPADAFDAMVAVGDFVTLFFF
jgi:hypothetical protein